MTLRTDPELDKALSELSAAGGISKQDVIRRAVLRQHAEMDRRAQVDAIMGDVLVDYADALDRLGKA